MAWTKLVAKSDKIMIDGTDVSNAFREFGLTSEDSTEDVSGFSASGVDETLPGARAQGFNGEAFNTTELISLLWPIHYGREQVEISWQPNGLVDAGAPSWSGLCTVNTYSPTNTRGSVSVTPFAATTADEQGITLSGT